ncbi:transposase InsO family protein [Paraburkholderia sp. GAS448]|uniref:integrase core domain-containing protein n=1 Tax=Paraburkholderia sp. GAS448 TaxID=3035136 RepID=UPI003D243757
MGVDQVLSAPRSPWQNPYVERLIGSIRRDCLDHVIVLNERHLRRILTRYFDYYHRGRTHLSLTWIVPTRDQCSRPIAARSSSSRMLAACITIMMRLAA